MKIYTRTTAVEASFSIDGKMFFTFFFNRRCVYCTVLNRAIKLMEHIPPSHDGSCARGRFPPSSTKKEKFSPLISSRSAFKQLENNLEESKNVNKHGNKKKYKFHRLLCALFNFQFHFRFNIETRETPRMNGCGGNFEFHISR